MKKEIILLEDYVGKRFGERVVLGPTKLDDKKQTYFLCRCDSGHETWVRWSHLKHGTGGVCNMCNKRRNATVHGHSRNGSLAYKAWINMRCRVSHDESYVRRGITCCDRWSTFLPFLEDMGEPVAPKTELDRIDGHKGYSPDNCRWATHQENNANRTNLRMLTFDGKTMCIAHWEKYLGIKPEMLRKKLRANRPLATIMTELGYRS